MPWRQLPCPHTLRPQVSCSSPPGIRDPDGQQGEVATSLCSCRVGTWGFTPLFAWGAVDVPAQASSRPRYCWTRQAPYQVEMASRLPSPLNP